MKALIDQVKLQKELYIVGSLLTVGAYLFGMILFDLVAASDDGITTVVYVGSLMALIIIIVFVFLALGIHLVAMFNYAVGMGRARKSFLPAYTAAAFFLFLVLGLELKLLHFLEGQKIRLMYPLLNWEDPAGAVIRWKYLIGFALAGTAFGMFFGAMIIRFGRAAFVVWWLLVVACCIGGPRLLEACLSNPDHVLAKTVIDVLGALARLGAALAPVLLIIVALILFGISFLILRKQQVNL